MSELKKAVKELIQDLNSNEVAIIEKKDFDSSSAKFLSYGKVELEGDAIQVLSKENQQITQLHNELLICSSKNRKAVWEFISRSLL
ncbi:hypothetical protein DF185_00350 [Marinifilum breve]|uniref:Uncharacterized protein n=1 Tax=Marinifilum breve TaxID=2184082 RepID=A0A2V4A1G4_9BACT|nr:hypothetical protein [Marinifilum breve]PXY02579.1 hypothetical protein DF185_00350 [Marinifilum breve]